MKMEAPGRPASRSRLALTLSLGGGKLHATALLNGGWGSRDELLRRRSREGPLLIGGVEGV